MNSSRVHRNYFARWSQLPDVTPLIAILMAVMISDLFLGDWDIGPASSRIYLLGLAALMVAARVKSRAVTLFHSRLVAGLAVSFAAFTGWAVFNSIYQGAAVGDTVETFGTSVFFGWLLFLVAQASITRDRDLLILVILLGLTASASALVAVLQWLGADAAWNVWRSLRPDELFDPPPAIPGMALFSVPLSYHLLVGGSMILGLVMWWPMRSWLLRGLLAGGLVLIALAIAFSLVRSAAGAGLIVVAAFGLIHYVLRPAWAPSFGLGQIPKAALVAGAAISIVIAIIAIGVNSEETNYGYPVSKTRYSLERLTDLSIQTRSGLWRYSIDSWLDSPIIGDIPAYDAGFAQLKKKDVNLYTPRSPHNLLLNSLVWYGLVGTILIAIFLGMVFALAARAIRSAKGHPSRAPVAIAATIGIAALLFNAQFHNESFLTGSTVGFWLVAFLAAIDRIAGSEGEPELKGGASDLIRSPGDSD